MSTSEAATPVRILIINPNTSTHMTEALLPVVESLAYPSVQYTLFTCPAPGIPSINSPTDAAESARLCLPHLLPQLAFHDAFLVACYSQHPLVPLLKRECRALTAAATKGATGAGARKYVTGIFEASVLASLALVNDGLDPSPSPSPAAAPTPDASTTTTDAIDAETFGIVSTGAVWEDALSSAVTALLSATAPSSSSSSRYAGCETTGLNASELHDLPPEQVRGKMMQATKRLLGKGRVRAVCLGCAGMVGLEDAVRDACVEELGDERGREVHIVDGVKAGVGVLVGLARAGF